MAEIRVLDFDRARAERRKTVVRMFGEDIPVPGSEPLGFVMLVDSLKHEHGDGYEPSFSELGELVSAMIGDEAYTSLMSHAPEKDDLEWLVTNVTASWVQGGDDEGEAPAPEQGAGSDIAESTGESSKPTSPESTEKT